MLAVKTHQTRTKYVSVTDNMVPISVKRGDVTCLEWHVLSTLVEERSTTSTNKILAHSPYLLDHSQRVCCGNNGKEQQWLHGILMQTGSQPWIKLLISILSWQIEYTSVCVLSVFISIAVLRHSYQITGCKYITAVLNQDQNENLMHILDAHAHLHH